VEDQPRSVLAIMVVRDGAPWIRRSLAALARQSYRRLGVLAVDDASSDESGSILREVLGARRVIQLPEPVGFPGAVGRALAVPAAREADFVLLLHDDTLLAPETIERLVTAAGRLSGTGVVGPKVLDWQGERVLREVGFAADRFGYPYSPLEEDEIDQGQYDATREVLFVSSSAMLVAREAWMRAGGPDERLRTAHADLDFCWRIRLAGFRVLVHPGAVAHHREAAVRGERDVALDGGERYLSERAGLLSLLKNYRGLTLLWVLPLYAIQGLSRLVVYLLTRHFDRAFQVVRAWGWNVLRLPGTIQRRVRAQATRRVRDHEIASYMAPVATRLQRWVQQASSMMAPRREGRLEPGEEVERPPVPTRAAALIVAHPVLVGWVVAVVLALVAFRGVLFVPRIEGGILPVFPERALDLLRAFAASWSDAGLGSGRPLSPALVPLGLGGILTFGNPHLLVRLLVAAAPIAAAASCYWAALRVTGERSAAVAGAGCYALSGVVMWSTSEGHLGGLALLVGLPWLSVRLASGWEAGTVRTIVGLGMGLALVTAFFPGAWLALVPITVVALVLPQRGDNPLRGLGVAAGAAGVAAVLLFPFAARLVAAGVGGFAAFGDVGRADLGALLRLAPGSAPGTWAPALFLPLAAALSFVYVDEEHRRWGSRALVVAAVAVPLAWAAAAGYLPRGVANPVAFLAAAAFSMSLLVSLGVRSLLPGVRRTAFGMRQVGALVLTAIVVLGLALQALQAARGTWAVGERRRAPAWPVVETDPDPAEFRVLWLGRPDGSTFPSPGGAPQAVAEAGPASVAFGVTERSGRRAQEIGLPADGSGMEILRRDLAAILSGAIRHGGGVLSSFGVRYVVAGEGSLPAPAEQALAGQLDLDLIQRAGGLAIYRNAASVPPVAVIPEATALARRADPLSAARLDAVSALPVSTTAAPGWAGRAPDGLLLATTEFDPRWRVAAGDAGGAFPAFGWALGAELSASGPVAADFRGGPRRTLELGALAVLWLGALWVVRRRGEEERRR
jgi:GT2 family glycosyltransferase